MNPIQHSSKEASKRPTDCIAGGGSMGDSSDQTAAPLPRRAFFRRVGGFTAASALTLPAALQEQRAGGAVTQADATSNLRRNQAYQTRQQAAMSQMQQPPAAHLD